MCGIAGVYNLNKAPISLNLLKEMAQIIEHRGPDGEGFYLNDEIGLAHRRLAILDTTARGVQPMTSKDSVWVVIFNGCIYNFLELKQELLALGHTFVSGTDTEVIVEGLSAFGVSFFERLNGMFAIGAWNKATETLYLSRDRFGIKPLYYWFNGKSFVFSSEIKAIILHPDYKMEVDLDALNQYFTFQNVFSYNTLFKGVSMLPPANTIELNSDTTEISLHSWWDFDFSNPDESISFEDSKILTKEYFEK